MAIYYGRGPGMPYVSLPVKRLVRFTPSEAPAIAAQFRGISRRASELVARLRVINSRLEADWDGRARVRFLAGFVEQPPQGENVSAWLHGEAARIEMMEVERWETVYEAQWVEEQGVAE